MKLNTEPRRITPAAIVAAASGNIKNFLAASTPGGIEAQEKAGQIEQAEKQTLPFDCGDRKPWEALGFKFGEKTEGIFVHATFPKGWTKKPTDHAMWSDIVDEKGRKRGAIFYKAAFYDRSANAHLTRRFGVSQEYPKDREARTCVFVSDACGVVQFKVTGLDQPDWSKRDEAIQRDDKIQKAREDCLQYLKTNFPDHDSPTAYWDC